MALTLGTPLAEALSNQIQPKLVDIGWSVGGEDSSPLSEYICLMLVNGKSQEQIAQELSGDLLGLPPGDNSATDFARWLFAKVDELSKTVGSDSQQPVQPPQQVQHQQQQHQQHHPQQHLQHHSHDLPQEHQSEQVDMQNGNGGIEDEAMQDGGTMERDLVYGIHATLSCIKLTTGSRPSAPKAMRQPNSSRLMNQLSKAMERQPNEQSLHRVRQQPSERIDKFKARDPPRGPASNRPNYRNGRPPFGQNGRGRAGPTFQPAIPPSVFANMNPQQQMAFFQMYQQQSQMMGPYMPPGGRGFGPPIGPNGQPMLMGGEDAYGNNFVVPLRAPPGPSLFERIENPPDMQSQNRFDNNHNGFRNNHNGTNNSEQDAVDETMEEGTGDESSGKPEETPCLYGTHCTKADCIYGHPPPAAAAFGGPKRTYISGEKCPFGAGCKNRKCTGSHPSPASAKTTGGKLGAAKIDQDCKFFPNCTNPSCPFKQYAVLSSLLYVPVADFTVPQSFHAPMPLRYELHPARLPFHPRWFHFRSSVQVSPLP